ncbi:triacylglycerol lipase 2-like [Musa acuminata AAA Group]|uniref:triacylglycerol lipase 2-like n=1 Tax=Musa acuminata AAA Group TaxID=214697 RepID=UPI0031E1D31B
MGFRCWLLVITFVLSMGFHCELAGAHGRRQLLQSLEPPDDDVCTAVVSPQGYECQEYEVKTQDGYILTMHRIPQGRGGGSAGKRQPVLLQHGVLMDGMTWLLNPPQQSLAFVLADNGFDVWITHGRGTRWSRRHESLDTSNPAYWAWSWDELASFDLPATVGFVFRKTGRKLHYVGHSMGTLTALSAFSEGKLVDKIKSAALLTPVAYLTYMTTPIGRAAGSAFSGEVRTSSQHSLNFSMLGALGVGEFDPKGAVGTNYLEFVCAMPGVNCYDLMASFTGPNCCLNYSTVDMYLKYELQPTSVRTLDHFLQTIRSGVITKYDYGSSMANMVAYGQSSPPEYHMPNIPHHLPLLLSYGGGDMLSDVKDVQLLLKDLRNHDADKLVAQLVKEYAHLDFVMGVNAKQVVYDGLIAFFGKHS